MFTVATADCSVVPLRLEVTCTVAVGPVTVKGI